MRTRILLLLLCISSLCVMGQIPICSDCRKPISQCDHKGKHPKCPVCGKIKEKCLYKFEHPKCNDCGKLLQNCQYKGKHPRCSDCGKLKEKCPYQGKHPRCSECGELLEKCKYGGKHPAPTPTAYNVMFYCNAHEATVFVDGKNMGSIYSAKYLKVGSHAIRITSDGYEPYTGVFDVNANNTSLTVSLDRIPPAPTTGALKITSTPSGATILVDGKSAGITPCVVSDLKEGQHSIRIEHSGYSAEQRNATVTAGKTSTITIAMQEVEQKPTPEVVKPIVGTAPVTKQRNKDFFHKKSFYVSPEYQVGSLSSIGASMGAYMANFNIEGFYHYSLSRSEEIWWVADPNYHLAAPFANTYRPLSFGWKLGYGMIFGTRTRLTPQVGMSIVSNRHNDGYATSLGLGCKWDFAIAKHFGAGIAPEYVMRINESKTYSELLNVSDDFDKWSSGFRCRIGISVFF